MERSIAISVAEGCSIDVLQPTVASLMFSDEQAKQIVFQIRYENFYPKALALIANRKSSKYNYNMIIIPLHMGSITQIKC